MKTKSLLVKYQRIIRGILGSKEKTLTITVDGKGIGEIIDPEKPESTRDFCLGKYKVFFGPDLIANFELYQMPHCCGIIVSCKASVTESFRNKGIGTMMNQLRQDLGRAMGYSLFLCTDIEQNIYQRKLLQTQGFRDIKSFVNKRTNNRVYISTVDL